MNAAPAHLTLKICGIRTPHTAQFCSELGVDLIGLMAYSPSPRHVEPQHAADMHAALRGSTRSVLVTANAEDAFLERYLELFTPHFLQLHGDESPQRVAELAARTKLPIIKAFGITSSEDLRRTEAYTEHASIFLYDAKPSKTGALGGTGQSFDWAVLHGHPHPRPWFLAGGLHAGNIAEAVRISGAQYLDLSSGVESTRGVKDHEKIRECVWAVRALT